MRDGDPTVARSVAPRVLCRARGEAQLEERRGGCGPPPPRESPALRLIPFAEAFPSREEVRRTRRSAVVRPHRGRGRLIWAGHAAESMRIPHPLLEGLLPQGEENGRCKQVLRFNDYLLHLGGRAARDLHALSPTPACTEWIHITSLSGRGLSIERERCLGRGRAGSHNAEGPVVKTTDAVADDGVPSSLLRSLLPQGKRRTGYLYSVLTDEVTVESWPPVSTNDAETRRQRSAIWMRPAADGQCPCGLMPGARVCYHFRGSRRLRHTLTGGYLSLWPLTCISPNRP